jgi:NADH:ubiquinone oxidoreductase subunit 6 (subunit J)
LLGSLAAYMFAIGLLFYCGMEFLGLVFLIILVGGISVMFLFILLIIDVRAENSKKLFFFDFSFSLSIFISFFLVSLFLYFYLCQLNPKLSYEIFFNVVAFNNINEIYIISVLLLSKHHILLLLVGFLLFLATITALILSVNVFEKDL